MVYILTVVLMIFFAWNLYSAGIVVDSDNIPYPENWLPYNKVILKIAKIYWKIVVGLLLLGVLYLVCFILSSAIICGSTGNDDPVCEIWVSGK